MILECKSCGTILSPYEDLSYGCPCCESRYIGKYYGIIGMYARWYKELKLETQKKQ